MIKYIQRKDLNVAKYNACIDEALNSRVYAYSWYLDIVADNWDALVLNDYEAVMPLPWRSKYFIKYVYPPCWTQQLGVFARFKVTSNWTHKFVKSIPKKFKKITIAFNSGNDCEGLKVEKRDNYLLDLNRPYEELYSSYSRSRKRRVKESLRYNLTTGVIPFYEFQEIANQYYNYLKISKSDYKKLDALFDSFDKNKLGELVGVYSDLNELIACVFLVYTKNRIVYLNAVATPEGKRKQATTYLLNKQINEKANQNMIFDFEGSMHGGIKQYFKSFGPERENYYLYSKVQLV